MHGTNFPNTKAGELYPRTKGLAGQRQLVRTYKKLKNTQYIIHVLAALFTLFVLSYIRRISVTILVAPAVYICHCVAILDANKLNCMMRITSNIASLR